MSYFGAIYTEKLPHRAKVTYMYLRDRANEQRQCWPGINRMARELDMSRTTIKRGLGDLTKAGYIKKELRHRGNGGLSSNLYTLLK